MAVAIENATLYDRALAARRAREDLLATVSHDLKNPLNAIKLSTRTLARHVDSEKAKDSVTRIDRAADRMSRLIGDLLDAAKIEAGVLTAVPQPEDATALIESAIELFRVIAAEKDIRLVAAPTPAAGFVSCERNLILRVLANLIGNAIKFSPNGSSISIGAEPEAGDVLFSVSDTGPGIPAEHVAHAFERYWQQESSDRRGSGLGLYIAKGIVEAHGGRIWIESMPGQEPPCDSRSRSPKLRPTPRPPRRPDPRVRAGKPGRCSLNEARPGATYTLCGRSVGSGLTLPIAPRRSVSRSSFVWAARPLSAGSRFLHFAIDDEHIQLDLFGVVRLLRSGNVFPDFSAGVP